MLLRKTNELCLWLYKTCKMPFRLRRIQQVDFTADFNKGMKRLLSDLGLAQSAKQPQPAQPVHTRQPDKSLPLWQLPTLKEFKKEGVKEYEKRLCSRFHATISLLSEQIRLNLLLGTTGSFFILDVEGNQMRFRCDAP